MKLSIRGWPWVMALVLALVSQLAWAKGFLWKVEGGAAPLYLVGVLPALPSKVRPVPYKFDRAYAETQVLVFTTDLNAVDGPELQKAMVQAGLYSNGETMHQRWPKDLIASFKDAANELRAPLGKFAGARPWLAALGLEMYMYDHAGFSSRNNMAHILYQRALMGGKSIITLNTPADQQSQYTSLPDSLAQNYLRATLAQLDEVSYSAKDVLELWNDSDVGDLEDLQSIVKDDYPAIFSRFITRPNRRWLPTILDLLRQGKAAMVVVGAVHIPGDNGLIAALRKGGYKVKLVEDN